MLQIALLIRSLQFQSTLVMKNFFLQRIEMASMNEQETSIEGQASSMSRGIGSLQQPTVESTGRNPIAFALNEVKPTNRWSGEMTNNEQHTSMESEISSIPRNISRSSREPQQPPAQFNDENQIVFALPEIHQQRNLTVGEFQNEAATLNTRIIPIEQTDTSDFPYC